MPEQVISNDLSLPNDIKELQLMVIELHEKLEKLERVERNYELENKLLRERINQLIQQIYGRKSEKLSSLSLLDDGFTQSLLFKDEDKDKDKDKDEDEDEDIIIPEHKRKKPGRKSLPDNLERVEIVHDIPEEEKYCGCGCKMSRMGEETSEQLEMIPAHFCGVRASSYSP